MIFETFIPEEDPYRKQTPLHTIKQ